MQTSALGHHALLILLLQISLLLATARFLGELARRWGQPAVVGELLAGILLGPTILGKLWPEAQSWLFPSESAQNALLTAVGRLGVLLLLVVTGLEIDFNLIRTRGSRVLLIAFWGTVVPLAFGASLGLAAPDILLQDPAKRVVFAQFMAVAMSISAMAVLAKILLDIQCLSRPLGQTMVATAMTEDLVGWVLLSAVVSQATGEANHAQIARALIGAVVFLCVAFTAGRWAVDRLLTWIDNRDGGVSSQVSATIVLTMLSGATTHALGLEPMLGALVAGMCVAQCRRFHHETDAALKVLVSSFLSPIFFASAGLKVDLLRVINPTVIIWGIIIFSVACSCKLIGVGFGAWRAGLPPWERVAFGLGLNARGSMEIIVATVGLNLEILAVETYSIIVMVALSTCLLTPPLLRWAFSKIPMTAAEQQNLKRRRSDTFLGRLRRVFMPLRGGPNAEALTRVASWIHQVRSFDCTLMHIDPPEGGEGEFKPDFSELSERLQKKLDPNLVIKRARSRHAVELIVRESQRGYELMMLGASQPAQREGSPFPQAVDRILLDSGCAVLVMRVPEEGLVTPRKILVPTTGTPRGAPVIELASAVALSTGASLTVAHVVEIHLPMADPLVLEQRARLAQNFLDQKVQVAQRLCPEASTRLLQGANIESEILQLAREEGYDLIFMGGVLRRTTDRAFLGQRAERLLDQSTCAVGVLCT